MSADSGSDNSGGDAAPVLSGLTIGSLTLTPTFDPAVTEYAVSTANATNKVTAICDDEGASITILNGESEVENGTAATWATGENTLTVTVTKDGKSTVYTVTVTKS